MNKELNAEEMAKKEVNKKLGKAIADRMLEIKRLEARVKKLNKEITKIKSGELVPDEEGDAPSESEHVKVIREEHHHHHHMPIIEKPVENPNDKFRWNDDKTCYYISTTSTTEIVSGAQYTC